MAIFRRFRVWIIPFLYACACLQLVRFYVKSSTFYLKMPAYLAGHERLPFQERVLPILFLRPMFNSSFLMQHLVHEKGVSSGSNAPFYLLSVVSLFAAAALTQLLYRKVSQRHTLSALVIPLFLFCVTWTYVIHNEANFSYPYDLMSLAFFTGGLYAIYEGRFVLLASIIFVGTFNRETTLFLIGIYLLDAAGRSPIAASTGKVTRWMARQGLSLRNLPWGRTAILAGIWLLVKVSLAYHFRHNDNSENFVRFGYNAARLKVRLIPALLNLCGYLLPIALLYWSRIRPARFGNYILILAVWLPIMCYTGVLLETRIYGELCSWTAIALTLLAEERAAVAGLSGEHNSEALSTSVATL